MSTAPLEQPSTPAERGLSHKVAVGAGCYWGTEKYIRKDFQKKFPGSIKSCQVGFMAPGEARWKNPSYSQVCTGASGHIEVAYIELNHPEQHFEELIRFFFTFHDPTTPNQQGNDQGFQYASWIFCDSEEQMDIAERVKGELQSAIDARKLTCFNKALVSTKITPLKEFTPALAAHQTYLKKHTSG